MRARPLQLLAVVLALAVLGWLLLPGTRGPLQGTASGAPVATQERQAGDAGPVDATPPQVRGGDVRAAPVGTAALPDFLPPQAAPVIRRIQQGANFPHRQDGSTFGNRERRLPRQEHGYYREYTVPTPGLSHRGARRIVTGGDPPREWYYTDDHYDSFRQFQPPPSEVAR